MLSRLAEAANGGYLAERGSGITNPAGQLGHANLGTTSMQRIDPEEIIAAVLR